MNASASTAHPGFWVKSRGLVGMAIVAPFLVAAELSQPYARIGTVGDFAYQSAAYVLFVIGAVFRVWATLYIGGRKGSALMRSGPYSICRNPLYLGTFLMLWSIVVRMESLTAAIGAALASGFYLFVTIRGEERRLAARFGAEYARYCARIPRLWPSLRHYESPGTVDVDLVGLARELRNAARWLWIPIVGEALAMTRAAAFLPDWLGPF